MLARRLQCPGSPRTRPESGAAAVEFALVLPVLLLLVFGIVQYGFYFLASQSGSAAAREAVRRVAVGDCPKITGADGLEAFVARRLGVENQGGLQVVREYKKTDGTPISSADSVAEAAVAPGDRVEVVVQFKTFDMNFPLIPVPEGAVISRRAEARIEDRKVGGTCA